MNFVADESADQPIVSRLRVDGHFVEAVSELSPGVTDFGFTLPVMLP